MNVAICICDVTTLTCVELEHAQSKQKRYAVLNVVNQKARFLAFVALGLRLEAKKNWFVDVSDSLTTLITCSPYGGRQLPFKSDISHPTIFDF